MIAHNIEEADIEICLPINSNAGSPLGK